MPVRIRHTDFFATTSKITNEGELVEIIFTRELPHRIEKLYLQMTQAAYAALAAAIVTGGEKTSH